MKFLILVLLATVAYGNVFNPNANPNAPPKNAAVIKFPGKVAKCNFEIDQGYCDNWGPRYAYDPKVGKCVIFNSSGASCGNSNNFKNEAECNKICLPNKRG